MTADLVETVDLTNRWWLIIKEKVYSYPKPQESDIFAIALQSYWHLHPISPAGAKLLRRIDQDTLEREN